MKKIIISIIMLSSVASASAQAPTNHYPNVAGTITRPGYVYKYRNDSDPSVDDFGWIELYNADTTFLDAAWRYRDGGRPTLAEALGSLPNSYYQSYRSHTYDQLRALVNSIFTAQQRAALVGSGMVIEIPTDTMTGKITDVIFCFNSDEPFVNIPVETYRAIELALKQNFTITATEAGKKFKFLHIGWDQEFESPTTTTELIPGAITRATQTIDSGMIPDMDIESISGVASASAQAPTNYYPNVAGTITRPGFVYKYRNLIIAGVETTSGIEIYNADNTFLDVEWGHRDGTPMTAREAFGLSDSYYFSYVSHTDDQLRALVNSIFTAQQRTLLAGSTMIIDASLDPLTSKVVDVVFSFGRDEPLVNIPVETYRAIELALKQNLTATATPLGRTFNYFSFSWQQRFESPTTFPPHARCEPFMESKHRKYHLSQQKL